MKRSHRLPSRGLRPRHAPVDLPRRAVTRVVGRLLAIAACVLPLSSAARAQQSSAPAPSPVVRTLMGDIALVMRLDGEGTLALGAAGARRTLSLSVRASDARRWADSAARLLVPPPRPRRGRGTTPKDSVPSVQRARALLEEPGVGAGSFVLTRVDSAGTRSFLLFIDDAELDPLRQLLEPSEASTLVRLVRKAATPSKAVRAKPSKAAKKTAKAKSPAATKPGAGATARPLPTRPARP
ncbi:MAG TPA: hypothetical protein PKH96_09735 [Gemmatimonadaceae bacterium]|nr:hypothetical protein [Gemmatimonadaceae bacterium]